MPLKLDGTYGVSGIDGTASTPSLRGSDLTGNGIVYGTDTVQIATGGTTAVTVDSSQNVGVGTASPGTKLHVSGGLRIADSTNSANYIVVGSGNEAPIGANSVVSQTGNLVVGTVAASTVLQFATTGTERARIDSSGNLLVNTATSVNGKLQVKNSTGDATSGFTVIESGTNNYWSTYIYTVTHDLYLYYTTANRGYFSSSTGAYTATSDRRLKKDIEPLHYGLSDVMSLKPSSYLMIEEEDGKKKHLGFIAQDLENILPEVVSEMQGGTLGVETTAIIPVLVKAIQELSAKLDAAEARIAALEAK